MKIFKIVPIQRLRTHAESGCIYGFYVEMGYCCCYRAWISQRYLQYAEFYIILDPLSNIEWILIGVGIGVVVLVIIVVIAVCLTRKKSSGSRRGDRGAGAEMVQLRSSNRIKTEDETG